MKNIPLILMGCGGVGRQLLQHIITSRSLHSHKVFVFVSIHMCLSSVVVLLGIHVACPTSKCFFILYLVFFHLCGRGSFWEFWVFVIVDVWLSQGIGWMRVWMTASYWKSVKSSKMALLYQHLVILVSTFACQNDASLHSYFLYFFSDSCL